MTEITWQQSGRQLVTVHGSHIVTFPDDLTIDEAKHVIVELLKQLGVIKTHTVGEMLRALADGMQE